MARHTTTALLLAAALVTSVANVGCVRRLIAITSEPAGATVWLNDREIGRTPCDAEFTYYGTYDVRLQLDGYEPLSTTGEAKAPIWDNLGPDLVAEALPAKLESLNAWHYTLVPTSMDHAALLERARQLRDRPAPASWSESAGTNSGQAEPAAPAAAPAG